MGPVQRGDLGAEERGPRRLVRLIPGDRAVGNPLLGGRMETNLFWRRDPGNIALFPDDLGGAVRWRVGV